jgi:imidazolonepropionase-like amidohydrolase
VDRLTFTNAVLLDPDEGPSPNASITVAGERIEAVSFGPPAAAAGTRVVDLKGRTVMPGLIHCHYHAAYKGVGGAGVPVGMEASPALLTLRAARNLQLALDAGFTGVVSAGAPYAIDAGLKAAIAEGAIRGPRIMAGSRDLSTTGHSQDLGYPWHWGPGEAPATNCRNGADDFRRGVREEIKRGAEIIKIFLTPGHGAPGPSPELELTREELAAAVETAHLRGAKVRAHTANRTGVLTALELGVDVIDHGDGLDAQGIELMLAKGAVLVPSMLFPYRLAQVLQGNPYADELTAGVEQMLDILPAANKAGVKIVLGDDFGAGPLQHGDYADELDFYVNLAGIPPLDVLRWGTRHGAELMGRGGELGAIRPGALADLIVVDGDPLADVRVLQRRSNVVAVLKGGAFEKDLLGVSHVRTGETAAASA